MAALTRYQTVCLQPLDDCCASEVGPQGPVVIMKPFMRDMHPPLGCLGLHLVVKGLLIYAPYDAGHSFRSAFWPVDFHMSSADIVVNARVPREALANEDSLLKRKDIKA